MISRLGAPGALALAMVFAAPAAQARPSYRNDVPQGFTFGMGVIGDGCLGCHVTDGGGADCGTPPCLNVFGQDFNSTTGGRVARQWDAWLRDQDSDGDLRTNGQELVYFGSLYPETGFTEGAASYAANPGFAASVHTDECFLQGTTEWGYPDHPNNYTNCATAATCTNSDADTSVPASSRYFGFTCGCPTGYLGNGRVDVAGDGVVDSTADGCTDEDECALASRCGRDLDASNVCENTPGGYNCICAAGYELSGSGPTLTCVEIGGVDAGPADAGAVDAGPVDAGAGDAGAVDAGAVDAGAVDASSSVDASVGADAGPRVDASDEPSDDGGGCGCRVTRGSSFPGPAALFVLGLIAAIRRRRR